MAQALGYRAASAAGHPHRDALNRLDLSTRAETLCSLPIRTTTSLELQLFSGHHNPSVGTHPELEAGAGHAGGVDCKEPPHAREQDARVPRQREHVGVAEGGARRQRDAPLVCVHRVRRRPYLRSSKTYRRSKSCAIHRSCPRILRAPAAPSPTVAQQNIGRHCRAASLAAGRPRPVPGVWGRFVARLM